MNETYFIKPGYHHKNVAPTASAEGEDYWTPYRLNTSKFYQHHVYAFARNLIKKNNLNSCVDVGCGSGYKLMEIIAPTGARVCGIDQQYIINRARTVYPGGEWIAADFERPFTEIKKFDVVMSVDVIEHLIHPDELLKTLKAFAHSGSYILISTPERDIMSGVNNNKAINKEHIREWNRVEFAKYLESRGFEVLSMELLPAMRFHFSRRYLSYLKHHWKNRNYNMLAVCRVR